MCIIATEPIEIMEAEVQAVLKQLGEVFARKPELCKKYVLYRYGEGSSENDEAIALNGVEVPLKGYGSLYWRLEDSTWMATYVLGFIGFYFGGRLMDADGKINFLTLVSEGSEARAADAIFRGVREFLQLHNMAPDIQLIPR